MARDEYEGPEHRGQPEPGRRRPTRNMKSMGPARRTLHRNGIPHVQQRWKWAAVYVRRDGNIGCDPPGIVQRIPGSATNAILADTKRSSNDEVVACFPAVDGKFNSVPQMETAPAKREDADVVARKVWPGRINLGRRKRHCRRRGCANVDLRRVARLDANENECKLCSISRALSRKHSSAPNSLERGGSIQPHSTESATTTTFTPTCRPIEPITARFFLGGGGESLVRTRIGKRQLPSNCKGRVMSEKRGNRREADLRYRERTIVRDLQDRSAACQEPGVALTALGSSGTRGLGDDGGCSADYAGVDQPYPSHRGMDCSAYEQSKAGRRMDQYQWGQVRQGRQLANVESLCQ